MNSESAPTGLLTRLSHLIHRYFIGFLISSYIFAGFFPRFGEWLRRISLGHASGFGETTSLSLTMVLLAVLLLNASLSLEKIRDLIRSPQLLLAGLGANLLLPIIVLYFASFLLTVGGTPEHLQAIIVALALLSTVPVAGASTAYTQNTDGDVPLAVGLVLLSIFFSPWLMPISLHFINVVAIGDYTPALAQLKGGAPTLVLLLSVLLPSVLGLGLRPLLGAHRIKSAKPTLKLTNSICLLLLNYTNASIALPQVFASPEWGFLIIALTFTILLCSVDFLAGWWLGRLLKAKTSQCYGLMFGVGMNNNGTALVLASLAFVNQPKILIPIILYNLVQNLIASGASHLSSSASSS
ncbi:MAG: Na+-dependent transporter [Verrucomicrobia bacterium]|nr:Na+-dependent transporter [Verrucomicrobiota bacterium]